MARIVNLRTRRKQKARDAKRQETSAAAKGSTPGVSRPERARAEAENRRAREWLEGHRLEGDAPDGPVPDER